MKSLLSLSVCLMLLCVVGCGNNDGRVPVTGEVTFNGSPLEDGNITFGGPQGAAGAGKIVKGAFTLSESGDEPGVQPGSYDVLVSSWIEERGSVRPDGSFAPGNTRIPLTYLDPKKSGLKAEVKSGKRITSNSN